MHTVIKFSLCLLVRQRFIQPIKMILLFKHSICRTALAMKILLLMSLVFVVDTSMVWAEDVQPTSFWDDVSVGGYSSAGIVLQRGGKVDAALNQFSLITSWDSGDRWRFFSELEVERPLTRLEGESFETHHSNLDLERLYLDYNLSEKLSFRVGRFLTPAGRWNLIHAAPLVWTSSRPLATTRLFPVSTNGLMLYGVTPLQDIGLEYTFYLEALRDQYQDGDEVPFKNTRGARIALNGKVTIGLNYLQFEERYEHEPKYELFGVDAYYKQNGWEWSGEAYQRVYSDGRDGGHGAYAQLVMPLSGQWYGITRLETLKREEEPYADRVLIGAAWKRNANQILKIEYIGGQGENPDSPRGLQTSFAILF